MYFLPYNIYLVLQWILISEPNMTTRLEDAKDFFVSENDNSWVLEYDLELNEEGDKLWHRYRYETYKMSYTRASTLIWNFKFKEILCLYEVLLNMNAEMKALIFFHVWTSYRALASPSGLPFKGFFPVVG